MSSEYILWGVPAYLAFLVFQLAKPVRNRSGWDFVVSIAIFALIVYVTVAVFYDGLHCWVGAESWNLWARRWDLFFPSAGSFRLALGILLSGPVGFVLGTIWSKWLHKFLSWLAYQWTGKKKSYQFSDVFFATCHDLLSSSILVTLNNSKVYVGLLTQATDDPNESLRYIKITPVMSGHRIKDSGQVVFDTDYVGDTQDPASLPNRDLLISMSNVVTLAKFDRQLHEWFMATGRTIIRSSKEPLETPELASAVAENAPVP